MTALVARGAGRGPLRGAGRGGVQFSLGAGAAEILTGKIHRDLISEISRVVRDLQGGSSFQPHHTPGARYVPDLGSIISHALMAP